MGGKYLLGLDAGTSGARCLVFDLDGTQVAASVVSWGYFVPQDAPSLAREFDPLSFWHIICRLIADTLKSGGIPPKEIAAVGVTSQRQAMVLLDKEGHELYAGPNLDLRAVFEGAAMDEEIGERIKQVTGHLPSFFFAPAKLTWFQKHKPETYERIASILTMADWTVWKLTGEMRGETTLAGEAGLLDVANRRWCDGLLEEMGLRANALIPLGNAGAIVGRLSKRAAAECGLLEGTTVALAGADTQCGLLGMGTVDENQVGVVVGWSAPLQMVTSKPIISPDGRSWTGCHLPTDRWVLECNPGDVGNAYSWLKDITANSDRDDFAAMDRLAQGTPVGSDGALAFLGSSLMDTNRLGLRTGGLLFPVPLTFDAVGRGHLIRAVLEASAYAIKANLLQLEEIASVDARQIAVGGGMTRSQTFLQILADVLGREVLVSSEHQVSALGAALCASIAIGHFGSFEEAASHRDLRAMGPDRLRAAEYLDHYERWLEVSSTLEEL